MKIEVGSNYIERDVSYESNGDNPNQQRYIFI